MSAVLWPLLHEVAVRSEPELQALSAGGASFFRFQPRSPDWVGEADDRTLWEHSKANGFTLVTLDSDFAEMAALYGPPPKVIWLRCGNQSTVIIEKRLLNHGEAIAAFDQDNIAACLEIF